MSKLEELFGIPADLHFNQSDLDDEHYRQLQEVAEPKAREFWRGEEGNARRQRKKPRSFETILKNTTDGFYAEYYLMQEYDFSWDPHPFRDLIHASTRPLEVKTVASVQQKYDTLEKIHGAKTKYPHVVMFFRDGTDYYVDSYFVFCETEEKYKVVEDYGVINERVA